MHRYMLLIVLTACSGTTFAACGSAANVYEDFSCYELKVKKDEAKLAKVYKKLMLSLDAEGKKYLLASQKSWVAYKTAQCDGLTDYLGAQAQGAGSGLIHLACVSEKIETRMAELQGLM